MMKTAKIVILLIIVGAVIANIIQEHQPELFEKVSYPLEYKEEIAAASEKYGLDPYLVCGIVYVESKFDPSSESEAGAVGLMQIMPDTGQWIAVKRSKSFSPGDLAISSMNIDMGCWYYRFLLSKYKNQKLALAAYNSGFKNVDRWLKESKGQSVEKMVRQIPFKETREFVTRVEDSRDKYRSLYAGEFDRKYRKRAGKMLVSKQYAKLDI
jgi:soluble lytic murein transglycosylase